MGWEPWARRGVGAASAEGSLVEEADHGADPGARRHCASNHVTLTLMDGRIILIDLSCEFGSMA